MKRAYDLGGIFGEASKNHDTIPTTNLRSDEIHPTKLISAILIYKTNKE